MNIYKLARRTVDKDPETRQKALATLAPVPDIWALHILNLAAEDETDEATKKLAKNAQKACENSLIKRILKYIPGLRKGADDVKNAVSNALFSPEIKVQTAAIQSIALSRNGGLIDTICHLANTAKATKIVIECLKCLGYMGQKKEAFFITGFTTHTEKHIRSAALVALSMIDKSLTWSLVIEIAASSSNHLASEAIAIIHSLRHQRLGSIFRFMLNSPDEKKAEVAIKVIAKLGDSPHLKLLKSVVTSKNHDRKRKAITVLKILERKKIDESSQLLKLAGDLPPLTTDLPREALNQDSHERTNVTNEHSTVSEKENNVKIPVPENFMEGLTVLQAKGPQGIAESAENEIDFSWANVKSSLNQDDCFSETASPLSLSQPGEDTEFDESLEDVECARKAILSQSLESRIDVSAARSAISSTKSTAKEQFISLCCLLGATIFYSAPLCIVSAGLFTLHLAQRRDLLSEPLWTIPPLLIIIGTVWMIIPNRTRRILWLSKDDHHKLDKIIRSTEAKTGLEIHGSPAIAPSSEFSTKCVSSLPLLPFVAGTRITIGGLLIPGISVHELKILIGFSFLLHRHKDSYALQYIKTFLDDLKWIRYAYSRDGSSWNPLTWYASFLEGIVSRAMKSEFYNQYTACDQKCASLYGSNIMAQTWTSVAVLEKAVCDLNAQALKNAVTSNENFFDFMESYLKEYLRKRGAKTREKLISAKTGSTIFVPPLAERLAAIAREKAERTRVDRPAASVFLKIDEVYTELAQSLVQK